MDFLDAVLGDTPEAVATPEPQAIETPTEQPSGPARGPDGKFTSASAEPAPQPEPAAEPQGQAPVEATPPAAVAPAAPEKPQPEPGFVPITALLDTRDKLKVAEERLKVLETQSQQRQQQPAPQPIAPPPSVFEDEQGYHDWVQQQIAQTTLSTRLDFSEALARREFGAEKVDAAKAWALERFAQSPAFRDEVLAQQFPYEYAVKAYDREQMISKVDPTEYDAFLAWKTSQAGAAQAQPTTPTAPPVVTPPAPSPSLAAAPSAGGAPTTVPTGPGQAFDQTFR